VGAGAAPSSFLSSPPLAVTFKKKKCFFEGHGQLSIYLFLFWFLVLLKVLKWLKLTKYRLNLVHLFSHSFLPKLIIEVSQLSG
jgi:hypothetical protein